SEELPQSIAQHLRWIMQKDLLGQDVFLIGPPGPLRRSIAMQYLELTKREVEYVALSRDTTETDLKQRREIRDGTAFYVDQCAVRAATEGRVLVLEGLEKAERNVLPVLNNLLENREMQLEDGRFLTSSHRYDKLLEEHTKEELDAWKIVRVSEDFRVIALGLPVPRYTGNPLDPPLRSRFQARDIYYLPFKDELKVLYDTGPNVAAKSTSWCGGSAGVQGSQGIGVPPGGDHGPLQGWASKPPTCGPQSNQGGGPHVIQGRRRLSSGHSRRPNRVVAPGIPDIRLT
ncbi:VWA8 protein, partial [Polypterus senegalus]